MYENVAYDKSFAHYVVYVIISLDLHSPNA